MHIFFSGTGGSNGSMAERVLADANGGRGPCIMLTHDEIYRNCSHATRRIDIIERQRQGKKTPKEYGRVWMHFLDSGAFGVYAREVKSQILTERQRRAVDTYAYYNSDAFWQRVDDYADFVLDHKLSCDYYANMDVIYHPDLSWKTQQYLEDQHKLTPVPVIHSGTPIEWVKRYLKLGYEFIGLGGFGGSRYISARDYIAWVSSVFDLICPPPKRLPIVKVHGFAMTNFKLLNRFPWWSVDSATWAKAASFGSIYVPQFIGGEYVFDRPPHMICASMEMSRATLKTREADQNHLYAIPPNERKIMQRWLERLELPFGSVDKWGDAKQIGVLSHYGPRMTANLKYFEQLEQELPEWPSPFTRSVKRRASFQIKV